MPRNEQQLAAARVTPLLKKEALRHRDLWFVKMGAWRWVVGMPDYLLCIAGRFVAIELKHPDDVQSRTSARQRYVLERIHAAGGVVAVCRSEEDVAEVLQQVRRGAAGPFAFDARDTIERPRSPAELPVEVPVHRR